MTAMQAHAEAFKHILEWMSPEAKPEIDTLAEFGYFDLEEEEDTEAVEEVLFVNPTL